MKIITVRQPWASSIMEHGKTIENRTWKPRQLGRIAIHAGAQIDRAAPPLEWSGDLGVVLGTVNLVSAHEQDSAGCVAHHCYTNEWAMWSEDDARPIVHWILRDPRMLLAGIRAKGQLGFWESPSVDHLLTMPDNYA